MKHKEAKQNGLVAGILTLGYFLLFYFIDRALILSPWVWWGSLVIYLFFMFRAVQQTTTATFRESLQAAFLVFVLANAIFYLFYYFLFSVFDPGLVDLQREMLTGSSFWEGKKGDLDLAVTPGRTLFSYAYSLIGGFVLALGVSGIARR